MKIKVKVVQSAAYIYMDVILYPNAGALSAFVKLPITPTSSTAPLCPSTGMDNMSSWMGSGH